MVSQGELTLTSRFNTVIAHKVVAGLLELAVSCRDSIVGEYTAAVLVLMQVSLKGSMRRPALTLRTPGDPRWPDGAGGELRRRHDGCHRGRIRQAQHLYHRSLSLLSSKYPP